MLDSLLDALSGALDIRDVFTRVSEIARTVLAHDAMAIAITLDNPPRLRVHALTGFAGLPEQFETPMPEPFLLNDPWEYRMSNFSEDPAYSTSPTVRAGMRSVITTYGNANQPSVDSVTTTSTRCLAHTDSTSPRGVDRVRATDKRPTVSLTRS